jgi:large subunit ribosomal protein L21
VYAVVQTGGKQYRAEIGQVLTVEKLDVPTGEQVHFDQVLLISDDGTVTVGTPTVAGAVVTGKVVRQDRGPKIIVFKYKPKVRYRRKTGHRQYRTQVLVQTINGVGRADARREATEETPAMMAESATPAAPVAIATPAEPVEAAQPVEIAAPAESTPVITAAPEQELAESTQE